MVLNSIALFLFLCGLLTVAIAIYAWRHRFTIGSRTFSILMFSMAVYILGYSMELASPDIERMLIWSKIQYLGILSFPTIYMIFTLEYSGFARWLRRKYIPLLFIIPFILLIIKFFDEYLHLIYVSAFIDTSGIIPLLSFSRGPLYLVMVAYNLVAVTAGNYFLIRKRHMSSPLYRKQTTFILAAASFIYLMYLIYLIGIPLIPGLKNLDLNPFVYMLWGIAIGYSIFRYRLFDLAPIARDTLIEILNDGVVVLDIQSRVVDSNPKANKIFGWQQTPTGEYVSKTMNFWISRIFLRSIEDSAQFETHLTKDNVVVHYELTVSILKDKQGQKIGYLIVIHDITERKEIEKELQELSLVDELTGLTNRRGFRVLANQLISMAHRMKLNAALIYIDLDGLKKINDTLGHASGDQAIIDTSYILKEAFRASDIIARFGGDEFVVLAIESHENSGSIMVKRLQEQLMTHNAQSNREYQLSFSLGLTQYRWEAPQSMESLLEQADTIMYVEKQAKKARSES